MSYYETFELLRKALRKVNFENGDRHLAIQVTITDEEASGVFYIEDLGDRVLAEPYNYYDNDADITSESSTLLKLVEKKLDFEKARIKAQEYVERYPGDEKGIRELAFLKTR